MLTLTRSIPQPTTIEDDDYYAMTLTVTSTFQGLEAEIFVFHQGAGLNSTDIFKAVASLSQMADLPKNAPATVGECQTGFYRLSSLTFVDTHPEALQALWEIIQEDVQQLVNDYKDTLNLQEVETVTYA